MLYLLQFTEGKANKWVQSSTHFDVTTGYQKAKLMLHDEYADEHKVASTYIQKLNNWPSIKQEDKDALQELSLLLINCSNYLENMSHNNQLHRPKKVMDIVLKLPYKMRKSWRRKTYHCTKSNVPVTFITVVEFVSEEDSLHPQQLFSDIDVDE